MVPHSCWSRLVLGLSVSALVLFPPGVAPAQTLNDGMEALKKKYSEHRPLIQQLFKGQVSADPNDKTHVEAIDTAAKYATYRVYLDRLEGQPGKIDRAFKDFEGDLHEIEKFKPATQALADIYRDKVRLHALEVIQHPQAKPIHKIHNARVLAEIAKLGQGKLAETLITVLKDDKQNPGVQYYTLRGLRTLLAQVQPMQMPPLLTKEEEANCAEAIVEFLGRTPSLSPWIMEIIKSKRTVPAEATHEIDGFRILRREGVRALAQIHTPAVSDKVRPALVLARFAGEDESIQPPPRIDERLEAAIGLARMQSAQNKDFQPDYAAGQIAKALGAFVIAAESEKEKPAGEHSRPWKIDAVRLSEALADLKKDSGKNPYVAQVVNRGTGLLDALVKGRQPNAGEKTWFTTSQSDPPSTELFKGVAGTAVKPAKQVEAPEK